MWPAAEASVKLPPPATCQRSKFSATKVLPTHRILPPPSKAPAIRRTTQPSPWLQYGPAGLPAPPRLTPPSAAARLHPRLQGSNHLLQPPPTLQSSHTLHQQEIGPWQNSVKFSPASLSHDVQASQISSPSTILSSPGNFKIPPLHSNQRPQRARAANHPTRGPGPIFTPSRTGPQRQALGQLRPRPGCRSPQPPPSSSFHRTPARNPAQRRASLRLHKPPHQNKHASVSGIQLHAASDQRTPPLPMARSSATHGQPYSISASPGARLPPPPLPPPPLSVHQALSGSNLPQSSTQTPAIPPPPFHAVSSVPGAPFSLSTTSPLPIPPNALALEPPPVANSIRSIRSQILSEIQNIGTGGGSTPHPSTSLFRTNIPSNHPLKPRSLPQFNSPSSLPKDPPVIPDSMEKLQTFHSTYNLPFPTFSLLAITSFISHLNINKKLQTSSIKGYLSGLQFFPQTFIRFPFRPYSQFTDLLTH